MSIFTTPLFNVLFSASLFYVAYSLMVYWHELGHFSRAIKLQLLPIPSGAAYDTNNQYGGIIFNIVGMAIPIVLSTFNSTNIFLILLTLFGLVNWFNVTIYMLLGPFVRSNGNILSDIDFKDYFALVLGIALLIAGGIFYGPYLIHFMSNGAI